MSSLVFFSNETDIILAMDTLAVDARDRKPKFFTTKFYPVPHLQGVIAGTGGGQFVIDWFVKVNTGMVVDDMVHLDYHAPKALREMWENRSGNYPEGSTTTIYHFGLPASGGPPCLYAYRSEKQFQSERLPQGLAVKPIGDVPAPFNLPADFGKIMESQRQKQKAMADEQRVHIGGDILVCHLTRAGINIYPAGSFPDRDQDRAAAFRKV